MFDFGILSQTYLLENHTLPFTAAQLATPPRTTPRSSYKILPTPTPHWEPEPSCRQCHALALFPKPICSSLSSAFPLIAVNRDAEEIALQIKLYFSNVSPSSNFTKHYLQLCLFTFNWTSIYQLQRAKDFEF